MATAWHYLVVIEVKHEKVLLVIESGGETDRTLLHDLTVTQMQVGQRLIFFKTLC